MNRFISIKFDEQAKKVSADALDRFEKLEAMVNTLKDTRCRSVAITKIEEAYMWINKAIRDDQIHRQSKTE